MSTNLAVGTIAISLTVLFHTIGLMALARFMGRLIRWFRLHQHDLGKTVAMVTTVLGLFLLHMVEIWAWAGLFLGIGAVADFGDALYFSTVTFSTVGYGDVSVAPAWRLLASLEAINGFILIGWSTAFLVAASTRYGPFRSGEHF
jgi:carbon starvation protein CstA